MGFSRYGPRLDSDQNKCCGPTNLESKIRTIKLTNQCGGLFILQCDLINKFGVSKPMSFNDLLQTITVCKLLRILHFRVGLNYKLKGP